jgi:hypothetical protein
MGKKFALFTVPVPLENLVQILPESGSAQDPDPHFSKMLDPYPDPHTINADPNH